MMPGRMVVEYQKIKKTLEKKKDICVSIKSKNVKLLLEEKKVERWQYIQKDYTMEKNQLKPLKKAWKMLMKMKVKKYVSV